MTAHRFRPILDDLLESRRTGWLRRGASVEVVAACLESIKRAEPRVVELLENRQFWKALREWEHGHQLRAIQLLDAELAMSEPEFAETLRETWVLEQQPGVSLPSEELVAMFRRSGYIGDAPAPLQNTKLYRGALIGWKRGLSWTADFSVARMFAKRADISGADTDNVGCVFEASVTPRRVLARFKDERDEDEYVIDPNRLRIELKDVVRQSN